MTDICPICDGTGFKLVRRPDGFQFAERCLCRAEKRSELLLSKARIPKRFEDCSFDAYGTAHPSSNDSLRHALRTAKHYVNGFPIETCGKGLLFTGSKGLGKTHLSVSILKNLIVERGASGMFWEHKELMESFRFAMFSEQSSESESRMLSSVLKTDVLVLDDLGDMTQSDWTWDTTSYIINTRYNANLSTIITTNLENRASIMLPAEPHDRFADLRRSSQVSLGDRIGDRMWSRLQEMCVVVEMHGEDFRQKVKRASFA